jgi:hypothetical protein
MKMNLNTQELFESSKAKRVYTEADGEQFTQAEKALGDNRLDVSGPGAQRNTALVNEFFQRNRQLPVTVANIYRAVEERKSEFAWLTQAQADWYRVAQQNPDLANALVGFLATQGQPNGLVKDGDLAFENLVLLFSEIQSRGESASAYTIQNAQDRIAHRPGKQLHRVPQPRRTEPISRAAKEDDGTPFLGRLTKQKDGSWGKSPADYAREAREAAEMANPKPTLEQKLSAEEQTFRTLATELTRYGTHGQHFREGVV